MAMEVNIKNHSDGNIACVTDEGQVTVQSESHELQHHIARHDGNTYQVEAIDTGITAQTQTILHIKNNDPDRICVIAFSRMQAINTASVPLIGDYWEIGFNRTVASGGTVLTPINTSPSAGKAASVTCTGATAPTMAGTMAVLDTQYPNANGQEIVYNKHGSIILSLNDTFEVRHTATGTGQSKARITFMMIKV